MTLRTLLFIGPQGSGKGTQLERLAEAWQGAGQTVLPVQTGDLFRALSTTDSYAAGYIKTQIETGALIPDALTDALVVERLLRELTADTTLLFDGYPRTTAQVDTLQSVLAFFARPRIDVIHLATPDAVVTQRMRERGRSDDTPEAIAARLATYHAQTAPLLTYFESQADAVVHEIDGAGSMDAVHNEITAALS